MNTNRYRANCHRCHASVAPHAGVWDGYVFCDEQCLDSHLVEVRHQADVEIAERHAFQRDLIRQMASEISDRYLPGLLTKATDSRIASLDDIDSASGDDLISILRRMHARNRRKEATVRLASTAHDGRCRRCGGAGYSDKWIYTGRVCYQCQGSGRQPDRQ